MEQGKLCLSDYKFMCVLWDNEPIRSGNLAKICLDVLGWKKSTTYTMLKKLSEKGYLKNENSIVTSVIPKQDVQKYESEYVVNNAFEGSLPAFVAAFVSNKKLSESDAEQIRQLIERHLED